MYAIEVHDGNNWLQVYSCDSLSQCEAEFKAKVGNDAISRFRVVAVLAFSPNHVPASVVAAAAKKTKKAEKTPAPDKHPE